MARPILSLPPPSRTRKPELGSKYRGRRAGYADTESGIYWEVMPLITEDDERLQKALLRRFPAQIDKDIKHSWRSVR